MHALKLVNTDANESKPFGSFLHEFVGDWSHSRVFTLTSDWFVALLPSVGIGQSKFFAFGFTTLNRKLL